MQIYQDNGYELSPQTMNSNKSPVARICPYLDFRSLIQLGSTGTEIQREVCDYIYDYGCSDRHFLNGVLYNIYDELSRHLDTFSLTAQEHGLPYALPPLQARYWNNTEQLFLRVLVLGDCRIDTTASKMNIRSGLCPCPGQTVEEYYQSNGIRKLRSFINLVLRRTKNQAWARLAEAWYFTHTFLDCFEILFDGKLCNVCMYEQESAKKICVTCLRTSSSCSMHPIYPVKACDFCKERIMVHKRTRYENAKKKQRLLRWRRWHCPLGNYDCERYGHEGQGCQCRCHSQCSFQDTYPLAYDEDPLTDEEYTE